MVFQTLRVEKIIEGYNRSHLYESPIISEIPKNSHSLKVKLTLSVDYRSMQRMIHLY